MEHRSISIADQIFDQLERDILAGKYARGEVMSELGLSKQLGVSRTPIREAIRRLEQEDFLEESGRGAVVVGILNVTDEELRAMRDVLDLQRFYVEKNGENSSDQIKNQDSEFHRLFYRSSGSKSYFNTLFALHKRMTKFRKASVSKQSRALQSHQEHEDIYAALAVHDPDAAERAALAHVHNARARMQSMMEG